MAFPFRPFRPSATRIDKAYRCFRRWALDELYGLGKKEEIESLVWGTEMHRQVAEYLAEGKPFDLRTDQGLTLLAGLHHLPAPKTPGMIIERPFSTDLGGMPFQGTEDITYDSHAEVIDHKSTKDLQYAKTPDDLRDDTQFCLYLHRAMRRHGTKTARGKWIYYQRVRRSKTTGAITEQPRALAVELEVSEEEIAPVVERSKRVLRVMYEAAHHQTPAEFLPYNPRNCHSFNRPCPHLVRCNISSTQAWEAFVSEVSESAFLAAMGAPGAPSLNPPPPVVASPAPPPPAFVVGERDPSGKLVRNASGGWDLAPEIAAPAPTPAPPPIVPPTVAAPTSLGYPPGAILHPEGAATPTHYRMPGETTWTAVSAPPPPPAPPTPPAPPPLPTPEGPEQVNRRGHAYYPPDVVFHPAEGAGATHFRRESSPTWLEVPKGRVTRGGIESLIGPWDVSPPAPAGGTIPEAKPKGRPRKDDIAFLLDCHKKATERLLKMQAESQET